jgi:exosortase C (VPDSG-CTERM-specific)
MPVRELKFASGKSRGLVLKNPASSAKFNKWRLMASILAVALLAVLFLSPLYQLLRLARNDPLYAEIPLIPVLCVYLIWLRRDRIPASFEPAYKCAASFFCAALLIFVGFWLASRHTILATEDYLAWNISSLLLFFAGICCVFPGGAFMRAFACPVALLAFTVPFPVALRHWIETLLQHGSATFAGLFFELDGAPVFQDGLTFHLPDITIQVAPECSGIHSTLALTIVSIAGSWLCLHSPRTRMALVLAVIPLALLRNGFRIFVIGHLCMSFGPQMIDSPIHHHGGPLFFALSLLPFFLLLILLRKLEGRNREPSTKPSL